MLDLGWSEILLIIVVAVLVIGPDELPVIMRTLGRAVRRLQYVKFALSRQFDDFMKDHDLDELRTSLENQPPPQVPPPIPVRDEDDDG